ncbi:hypothetical protein [Succiniclasticum ruminis]|uniref:Uncharacterized protein n=1 Tax=Succiniclasticum ruminis DSM 9236 TaxID=1123323 RepID=A0A1I2B8Q9_9FIRM|nr:hypothetical protein [Succiniclasticum ruminis]SFE52592.1 hypothetical protein SAMN05216245_10858 [Succiniclasticum ruminis DSM 9236]
MYEYKSSYTKEDWDKLQTKEQLYSVLDADYTNKRMRPYIEGALGGDPEMKQFYSDEEFREMAAKIREAAEPLLPLLNDVLKHLPEKDGNGFSYYPDRAEAFIRRYINPNSPDRMVIYAAVLMLALKSNFIERLAAGFGLAKERAGKRAFQRYLAFKKEDDRKRKEFEKTEAFRVQSMELQLGLRDHIDYPE